MNSETLLPRSIKAEMDWGRQRKGGREGEGIAAARGGGIPDIVDLQHADRK